MPSLDDFIWNKSGAPSMLRNNYKKHYDLKFAETVRKMRTESVQNVSYKKRNRKTTKGLKYEITFYILKNTY